MIDSPAEASERTPLAPAAPATTGTAGEAADWDRQDSAATFFLAHRIAGGKEARGGVDTERTLAVIARAKAGPS